MKQHKIGEIFEVVSGSTPSTLQENYWDGSIKWITPKDLSKQNNAVISETERKITKAGLDSCSTHIIPKDSIIISSRAPIGYVAILGDEMCCNQGCKALVPTQKIDPYYFYYLLKTKNKQLNDLGTGSTFKELSKTKLEDYKVLVPDLHTQNEISALLKKIDKARQLRRTANALTDQFLQSTYLSMFGDPVTNPKGWKVRKMDEVATINPRMNEERMLPDDYEVSFIPMAAIDESYGRIMKNEIKVISEVNKGYTYFIENDVLFAKITPCMENGKAAIARGLKNKIGFGTTEFHVFRCSNTVIPEYIFALIRLPIFRKIAEKNMTGSAGQKRVPTDFLKRFNIPVPPIKLQQQFANIVTETEQLRQRQRAHEVELEQLFRGLLQRYFG